MKKDARRKLPQSCVKEILLIRGEIYESGSQYIYIYICVCVCVCVCVCIKIGKVNGLF